MGVIPVVRRWSIVLKNRKKSNEDAYDPSIQRVSDLLDSSLSLRVDGGRVSSVKREAGSSAGEAVVTGARIGADGYTGDYSYRLPQ